MWCTNAVNVVLAAPREDALLPDSRFSSWTLRMDGFILGVAGSAAMLSEWAGHFFGIGPSASTLGSPHTIGGFEAHGLAVLIAVLLFRGARSAERAQCHVIGSMTHLFLGAANILFWVSFIEHGVVPVGFITTILHGIFAVLHTVSIWRLAPTESPARQL
jgi:hypothetical protein